MDIKLVPVTFEEKESFVNLYQFYLYDFSLYTVQDVSKDGRFEEDIDYFWEGDKLSNPYFIELSRTIVGFLVVLFEDLDTDPESTHVIYDFKNYRRNGIGKCAAKK